MGVNLGQLKGNWPFWATVGNCSGRCAPLRSLPHPRSQSNRLPPWPRPATIRGGQVNLPRREVGASSGQPTGAGASPAIANSLAEGAGGCFHARGDAAFGMTGGGAAPLAESFVLLQRQIKRF